MDVMDLCLLLALVVLGCWCVDSLLRVVDEDVLESPRTLQPLEAAGQPERRDPTAEVCESRRVGRVFGDQGPGGVYQRGRIVA